MSTESTFALVTPYSSAMIVAYTVQLTTSAHSLSFDLYVGPNGSFEIGDVGKITQSLRASLTALLPTSAEPSVVIISHSPAMNLSTASAKASTVTSSIVAPASHAPSVIFFSVVVPALVHTLSPSISASVELSVIPSAFLPSNC